MSGKEMVPFGAAIAGDVLSRFVPGGGFLGKLGDKYLEKKRKEAAEILIEEIAKGSNSGVPDYQILAVVSSVCFREEYESCGRTHARTDTRPSQL